MARDAVDQLLYLLDRAFDGREWHSLLGNLRAVTEADWRWVPQHGHRSIRDIVQHVGGCKLMYEGTTLSALRPCGGTIWRSAAALHSPRKLRRPSGYARAMTASGGAARRSTTEAESPEADKLG